MKNFNIITFVLGIAINCSAQTTSTHDCSNDSAENKLFLVFLDTCKLTNFDPINVYEQFFEPNVNDDCFCNLLRYSRVFDYLLNNDLDIRYDMLKSPPIHVSANLSPDDPYILEMKKNRRRYKLQLNNLLIIKPGCSS